jgi:hypothetical protein
MIPLALFNRVEWRSEDGTRTGAVVHAQRVATYGALSLKVEIRGQRNVEQRAEAFAKEVFESLDSAMAYARNHRIFIVDER